MTPKGAVMSEYINGLFYSIKSLNKIFSLCEYSEKTNTISIYYLLISNLNGNKDFTEQQEEYLRKIICSCNKDFDGRIEFYNLHQEDSNIRLATTYGCESVYLPDKWKFPLIGDVDPTYDADSCPFILGYDSINYMQTILSMYFSDVFRESSFQPTTPENISIYNNELLSERFKESMPERLKCVYDIRSDTAYDPDVYIINGRKLRDEGWKTTNPAYYIRKNQINSGRHIDIARLNEKQDHAALKRLLGMSGYQILESELEISSSNDTCLVNLNSIAKLFGYHASDVLNLRKLFYDKNYFGPFQLKRQILIDYPELIFNQKVAQNSIKLYEADKRLECVKMNRATINSSSAQLAAGCLCPYGTLPDAKSVSFMYPSEKKAKELGIPRVNVLDETVKFIDDKLRPLVRTPKGQEILNKLDEMIAMYRKIEGKDFNATHADKLNSVVYDLNKFKDKVNVPYMNADGEPSSCYVTFSVGGLHGAEYNKALYYEDYKAYTDNIRLLERIIAKYNNASNLIIKYEDGKPVKRKTVTIDGTTYPVSQFVKAGCTLNSALNGRGEFRKEFMVPKKPELFVTDNKGNSKLNPRYCMTSFGNTNHEDFTSYYVFLLINMSAFENPDLGYDRYQEIFGNKQHYGELMKDKSLDKETRELYSVMRNGTKLILNSASGAADVSYNTSIRMNNMIIAMRIIGQLFTWRIGQAQTLEGAKVVSTNTDGLYTVFDAEENSRILKREVAAIHVGIEPEPIYLVSKDANNRWEGVVTGNSGNSLTDVRIIAASGGTLRCRMGPDTLSALDHPAVIDWALSEFTKWKALSGAMDDFVPEVGKYLIEKALPYFCADKETHIVDRVWLLKMFQNVIAANPNNGTYHFAAKEPISSQNELSVEPIKLQHYNRVFYVDPAKVPAEHQQNIVYLASAYVRPYNQKEKNQDRNPLAVKVICELNHDTTHLFEGAERLKKINGIEHTTPCIICNEDLNYTNKIAFDWLDFDYYNSLLSKTYRKNWEVNKVEEAVDDNCGKFATA